jgi:ClpX C4-type zinc finger
LRRGMRTAAPCAPIRRPCSLDRALGAWQLSSTLGLMPMSEDGSNGYEGMASIYVAGRGTRPDGCIGVRRPVGKSASGAPWRLTCAEVFTGSRSTFADASPSDAGGRMTIVADYVHRFTRRFHRSILCSACHLPRAADRRLLSGPSIYICESCVGAAAARRAPSEHSALCSFCAHPDRPVVGSWPELSVCGDCVELAQRVLADDSGSDPPSNER